MNASSKSRHEHRVTGAGGILPSLTRFTFFEVSFIIVDEGTFDNRFLMKLDLSQVLIAVSIIGELAFPLLATPPSAQINTRKSNAPLQFEVTSVKPGVSNGLNVRVLPDGIVIKGISSHVLLTEAFQVQRNQIIGAPQWVNSRSWDIQAKVAEADISRFASFTFDQKRYMLQQILRDRFNMHFHREVRKIPAYVLQKDTGGPMLQIADPQDAPVVVRPGHVVMKSTSITTLASVLSGQLDQIVVDQTGLAGLYDIKLDWRLDLKSEMNADSPERSYPDSESKGTLPDLFTAIREQLGLRLVYKREPVEVIVIDNLESPAPD